MLHKSYIMLASIFITILPATVYSFDLSCFALKETGKVHFQISSGRAIENIHFSTKTPNIGDPWIQEKGCQLIESSELECPNDDRKTRPQSFRIDVTFTDNTNSSKELWYYDCYKKHGVESLKMSNVEWNSFDIEWEHYAIDDIFIKDDFVSITDDETLKVIKEEKNYKKQVLSYTSAGPDSNYTVCVGTKFYSFLKGSAERDTKEKCITVTTPGKPKDETTDLKTPLLAVGIGILCLVLLCLIFVIYNKKCKPGGDHGYDMNKEEALMGGDRPNAEGEEMKVVEFDETKDTDDTDALANGHNEEA
eukprot:TCONS_00066284-protein